MASTTTASFFHGLLTSSPSNSSKLTAPDSAMLNWNQTRNTWDHAAALGSNFTKLLSNNSQMHLNNTKFGKRGAGLIFDPEYHITWVCFACAIIIANTLVLFVFKSDRKLLKRTPANNLLLSLAVNDLLTGLASLLQVLPFLKQSIFISGGLMRRYTVGLDVLITHLSVNSVIHLCLLAAERYLSIFYALQFKGLVTTRRVRYFIISAWSIAGVIALVQFTWLWSYFKTDIGRFVRYNSHKIEFYYTAIVTVTFAIVPLILLAMAYIRMFLMCKKLIREAPDNLLARKKTVNKELKILLMYFMMYVVFIVLCVPFFSVRLAVDFQMMLGLQVVFKIPSELIETFVLARFLASGVNPFIYTLYKQDFRRTIRMCFFHSVVCKRCWDVTHIPNGDGNETCTREIFASFGTQMTTLKKYGSETGLSDASPKSRPLLAKKDTHTSNGSHRLMVHNCSRF